MTVELERRYHRLLRFYPAEYRRARGDEMLDVLLASTEPGRRRPPLREQWALVVGALRARVRADRHLTAGQRWLPCLRTAAVMLLLVHAGYAAETTFFPTATVDGVPVDNVNPVNVASLVIGLGAAAAVAAGWSVAALLAVTVNVVLLDPDLTDRIVTAWNGDDPAGYSVGGGWFLPVVGLLLIPLIGRGRFAAPRSLDLLALFPLLTVGLDLAGRATHTVAIASLSRLVWQVVFVAAVLWALVDERPALSVALGSSYVGVIRLAEWAGVGPGSPPGRWVGTVQEVWAAVTTGAGAEHVFWDWYYIGEGALFPLLAIACCALLARRRARL